MAKIEKDVVKVAFFFIVIGVIYVILLPALLYRELGSEVELTILTTSGAILISIGLTIISLKVAIRSMDSSESALSKLNQSIEKLQKTIGSPENYNGTLWDDVMRLKEKVDSIDRSLKKIKKDLNNSQSKEKGAYKLKK